MEKCKILTVTIDSRTDRYRNTPTIRAYCEDSSIGTKSEQKLNMEKRSNIHTFLNRLTFSETLLQFEVAPSTDYMVQRQMKPFACALDKTYTLSTSLGDFLSFMSFAGDRITGAVRELFPMLDEKTDRRAIDFLEQIFCAIAHIPTENIVGIVRRPSGEEVVPKKFPSLMVEEISDEK